MINELKNFCNEFVDAELNQIDKKVQGQIGSYIHISSYEIKIPYKGFIIQSKLELGNHNLCEIKTELGHNYLPDFEITTRDHFINLFLRKKNMLIVKCNDSSFKDLLIDLSVKSNLESIAKNNSFEPKIQALKETNIQLLNTSYSLQLEDKIGSLRAIISFYKFLIDRI